MPDFLKQHRMGVVVPHGDVVAMVHALTGDLAEAQDLAQEAFCRAWQRWKSVSTYEEPLAWIRRVAFNLANSRWQRARVAARYLRRLRERHIEGPNPDRVAAIGHWGSQQLDRVRSGPG